MKVTIKVPKPRNPLVAPARTRKAGAHAPYNPARQERRIAKQKLGSLRSGQKSMEDYDA